MNVHEKLAAERFAAIVELQKEVRRLRKALEEITVDDG